MLSRIADNLFWVGRYLERAENLSRYAHVHYYASLDAPSEFSKRLLLESILRFAYQEQSYYTHYHFFDEVKIGYFITTDDHNPYSISRNIIKARENTRGARDSISTELWESVNKMYHKILEFPVSKIEQQGIWGFTDLISQHYAVVNGYIENSLTHNEAWAFIRLGTHIERACQLIRMIQSKLSDIEIYHDENKVAMEAYHTNILLRSTEATDMCRLYYKTNPNWEKSVQFLVLNADFPRSINFCLQRIKRFTDILERGKNPTINEIEFKVGKLSSKISYLHPNELMENLPEFLSETLSEIYEVAQLAEHKYLSY